MFANIIHKSVSTYDTSIYIRLTTQIAKSEKQKAKNEQKMRFIRTDNGSGC